MTERGQITIPKEIRDRYGFSSKTEVEVQVVEGVITIQPKRNAENFDAAAQKWIGSGRERIRKLGFKSSDDFFRAVRGR